MSNVNIWLWVLALIIAYLLGNISPSTLLAKAKGIDIHKEGSGNAGTTNALRVMGKKAGVITLVVDVLKGTIAVLIGFLLALPGKPGVCWQYSADMYGRYSINSKAAKVSPQRSERCWG